MGGGLRGPTAYAPLYPQPRRLEPLGVSMVPQPRESTLSVSKNNLIQTSILDLVLQGAWLERRRRRARPAENKPQPQPGRRPAPPLAAHL